MSCVSRAPLLRPCLLVVLTVGMGCSIDRASPGRSFGGLEDAEMGADVGTPNVDAGAPVTDTGAPRLDADLPVTDTGAPVTDTGTDAPALDAGSPAPPGCLLPDFASAILLTVTNGGAARTDLAVRLVFDSGALIAAGQLLADCADLAFHDGMGLALPFWIESGCNTANTVVWVRLAAVPSGDSTFYAQLGNPAATSTSSGEDTFHFFSDFDDDADPAWVEGVRRYDGGSESYSVSVTTEDSVSPARSIALVGHASCGRSPYNGVAPTATAPLAMPLPQADYALDFHGRAMITDFRYSSTLTLTVRVEVNGAQVLSEAASCYDYGCSTDSGWVSRTIELPATAIDSILLEQHVTDCGDGTTRFDNVRVRRLATPAPTVATAGMPESCP